MQDLRISVGLTHMKKNNNNNSHDRFSLTNAEGLRDNTCNAVSPSVTLAVAKLRLVSSIFEATPALFYTKNKDPKKKYSWTEFFFFSVCCSI